MLLKRNSVIRVFKINKPTLNNHKTKVCFRVGFKYKIYFRSKQSCNGQNENILVYTYK